jgi:archaellum biogenesis ATPase FlaH
MFLFLLTTYIEKNIIAGGEEETVKNRFHQKTCYGMYSEVNSNYVYFKCDTYENPMDKITALSYQISLLENRTFELEKQIAQQKEVNYQLGQFLKKISEQRTSWGRKPIPINNAILGALYLDVE